MSSLYMACYGYISDHIFSFKLALFALFSNCYAIFSLEDSFYLASNCLARETKAGDTKATGNFDNLLVFLCMNSY